MSSREKRLLALLLSALFLGGSFLGFNALQAKSALVRNGMKKSEATLALADLAIAQADSIEGEAIWLEENLPEPQEGETMPSKLETFATSAAISAGLSVTRPKILTNEESGIHFHRARFQIAVSGEEKGLYGWLARLHNPEEFRAVTSMRLTPNREDDTLIDATVQVEEWFIPKTEGELLEDPNTAAVEP